MKPDRPSITAENIAALRAIETMRPEKERIFSDPFAVQFLSDRLSEVSTSRAFRERLLFHWERVTPGVCGAVLIRTRFIDDCLTREIEKGVRQIVILGAGYDTRALRFSRMCENSAVFELDHPATQKLKLDKIKQHMEILPKHVQYISIQFEKELLEEKLYAPSFDPLEKTFFVWEGVSYYMPPAAVDRTLFFIANHSGEGSSVVFDYFPPSVADGSCLRAESVGLRGSLKVFGEEILFGIAPEKIVDFLEARGFFKVKNCTAMEYRRNCGLEKQIDLPVSEIFHFVHAKVKPKTGEG